jgi:hypothetical protein
MILNIFVIVIVVGVAYFHYVQGALTSVISAFCAVVGVLVAFGYYEQLLAAVGHGQYADYAAGSLLLVLYAVTYLVLRVIFDLVVQGNISLHLYVEKATAVIAGLVAGVLCGGVFATAAQMMPLGASPGGYTRYALQERQVIVGLNVQGPGGRQQALDSQISNELVDVPPKPDTAAALILPADAWVVSLASTTSSGAFSGAQDFSQLRSHLLDDLFYNRLGVDQSGQRVIVNSPKLPVVKIDGLYTLSGSIEFLDAGIKDLRPGKTSLSLKPAKDDVVLVMRTTFDDRIADKDGYVRVTPAAVRLVIGSSTFHPVGTIESATRVGLERFDDQILVRMSESFRGADFVFVVPKTAADELAAPAKGRRSAPYVQFKLFGLVDLSDQLVSAYPGVSDTKGVLRRRSTPLAGG